MVENSETIRKPPGTGSFGGVFGAKCACPPLFSRFSDRFFVSHFAGLTCVILVFVSTPLHAAEPTTPTKIIRPFNGKNLDGFYTFQKDTGHQDPNKVYSVSNGMIHISGEGRGYLATEEAYRDYHLSIEYKWGKRTDGSGYVRNSGILLHKINPDSVWPTSIEVQLAQGCEADLIVIRGKDENGKPEPATITSEVRIAADKKSRWQPGGKKLKYSGRQFWWSKHQVGFKEKLDTRGKDDVASPLGEWTRVECICRGDRITVKINGQTVNECFDVHPSAGRILLQNEGNEIYFRNFELRPLKRSE